MENLFSSNFTLGILGGGQLGKMTLTETRKYDIRTRILDPSADAPCRIGCNEFVQGSLMDFQTVLNFGRGCDVLSFEIEHVNVDALEQLQKEGIRVFPQPQVLRIIQNKVRQKEFYAAHGIPTAPFVPYANRSELLSALQNSTAKLPAVWKSAEGGYDGKGVSVLKTMDQVHALPDAPCMLEELVDFALEIAVIVARNERGEMATYPVVEMEFHPVANLVEYVLCPARISNELQEKARSIAVSVADALQITGLLAVEMFLTKSGEILVNESAPRVHNSGHLTIEAAFTSQFEQQLRAILNLPLGSTEMKLPAVMVNLVGEEGHSGEVVYQGYENLLGLKGVNIHLYGKRETRPFRKMGHVTTIDQDLNQARARAEQAKNNIRVIATNQ